MLLNKQNVRLGYYVLKRCASKMRDGEVRLGTCEGACPSTCTFSVKKGVNDAIQSNPPSSPRHDLPPIHRHGLPPMHIFLHLAVNIVRLDKICYAQWAHGIGGMGQNLRKTPKTIRGFIIYLTISLKNSFLSDIEDRIHQTLIAYNFLTSDAYITSSASIVPVLISALP